MDVPFAELRMQRGGRQGRRPSRVPEAMLSENSADMS